MLICLWKGCEFASGEMAAFQEHLITKHALQQQQQLKLDKQNDDGPEEEEKEMVVEEQMANVDKDNMIKRGGKRKIIFLAVEVWVDVLGFIRRIQLARSVCLINCKIYDICWPRLHGDKVVAHEVGTILIGYRHELGQPPTAFLLLNDCKEVPFPECPPPGYITGFRLIHIKFLDHQVLAFLLLIVPRITTNILLAIIMQMSHMEGDQVASVKQLLQLCREKMTTIPSIDLNGTLSNVQFLPDVDNKMKRLECIDFEESDIPKLIRFLTSPRPDGQQRVMKMRFILRQLPLVQKMLDAIKEEFRASTQPVPQPFFLQFNRTMNIPRSEEHNLQTDETLTIMRRTNYWLDICRHRRGQYEQWAEDARKRLNELSNSTYIVVDISEFGVPFSMDSS